jgi:4-hydroxybenzoate polyprenyltransferase
MNPASSAPAATPATSLLAAAVRQLRPKQWTKNGLLFAALLFSGEFLHGVSVGRTLAGFVAFSLLSSAGYVWNDWLDREADRRHPTKRHRPIASGALPERLALIEMAAVGLGGAALAAWLSPLFFGLAMAYLVTTLAYSLRLKHVVILDVMVLSLCYVWRVIAGAAVIGVAVSPWLFLCTAFVALFLGFGKRRAELAQIGEHAGTRKNLAHYSAAMLDQFQSIVTGGTVLSYALYAVMGPSPWMMLTVPHVLYGIFRYIYLVDQRGEGGAPDETLLRDRPILITVFLYGLTVAAVVYAEQQGWASHWSLGTAP